MKKKGVTQMRVIVLLKTWIEKYVEDFMEAGMDEVIKRFEFAAPNTKEAFNIEKAIASATAKAKEKKEAQPWYIERSQKKNIDVSLILNVNSTDLAKQITIVCHHIYKAITSREFLKEIWKLRDDSNIKLLFDYYSELARWVATCILRAEKLETRTQIIHKLIDTAQACLNLKNFVGVFGILSGLNHPSVERLQVTFQNVKAPFMSTLKSLNQLMSKDSNFKNYRAKLESSSPPVIPYLEPFLEELTYIDSSNQDIGKGGIINFSKHRSLARLIRHICTYQQASVDIKIVEPILQELMTTTLFTEDSLKRQSLLLEPPTASFLK